MNLTLAPEKTQPEPPAWQTELDADIRPRPRLLFEARDLPKIRRAVPDGGRQILADATRLLATSPEEINRVLVSWSSTDAVQMAEAFALTGEEKYADWTRRRLFALAREESWIFSLHKPFLEHCDHVMANVGAGVALAHDLLGASAGEELTATLETELQRLLFDPFLTESLSGKAFWAHPKARSNWTIMTAGDAGFAMVALGGRWKRRHEGIEAAIGHVKQTLAYIGPEGDWFEGICYWFATLAMGLRFVLALERAADGAFGLSNHPALKRTGFFAALSSTPAGRIYAYGDNWANPNHIRGMQAAQGILMACVLAQRPDWLRVARFFQNNTLLWAAMDSLSYDGSFPEEMIARFDETGTATIRSGWSRQDAFVGMRAGGTETAHDHLDAASFHFEAKGVPLIIDPGCWWYGDGAHDMARKTNYDGPATIGHSTLLVNGRGQEGCKANKILDASGGFGWSRIVADASSAYGDRLERFIRTIVLLGDNALVIRDVVKAPTPVHCEWLLQHQAEVSDDGPHSIFVKDGVRMCVTPLAPQPRDGYRITDSVRRTLYVDYDTEEDRDVTLYYRGYGLIDRVQEIEFLTLVWVGPEASGTSWDLVPTSPEFVVRSPRHKLEVRRKNEELVVEAYGS